MEIDVVLMGRDSIAPQRTVLQGMTLVLTQTVTLSVVDLSQSHPFKILIKNDIVSVNLNTSKEP